VKKSNDYLPAGNNGIAVLPEGFRPASLINFSGTMFTSKENPFRHIASITISADEIGLGLNTEASHCVGGIVFVAAT